MTAEIERSLTGEGDLNMASREFTSILPSLWMDSVRLHDRLRGSELAGLVSCAHVKAVIGGEA